MAASPPLYWAPDKDPSWSVNPGVLAELINMVPTTRNTLTNYACTPQEKVARYAYFSHANNTPMSAAILQIGSSATQQARLIVGCNFDGGLLEPVPGSSAFVNVSRVGGYDDIREWQFSAFGDMVLAVGGRPHHPNNIPQRVPQSSTVIGTAFADLTGGTIKGACLTVQKGFIVLANVADSIGTWYGDGWACSGLNNTASWVTNLTAGANLATGANYGRMLDAPGQIRALVNLRDGIVAYKPDAMLLGRYTANPFTWSWSVVSDGVGSATGNNIAVVNGVHYFLHRTGLYAFDGSVPKNIGEGKVNDFISRRMKGEGAYTYPGPKAVVDDRRNTIYWFLQTNEYKKETTAYLNAALAFNYVTGQCGWVTLPWSDNRENILTAAPFGRGFGCPVMASQEDIGLWDSTTFTKQYQGFLTVGNSTSGFELRMPLVGQTSAVHDTASQFNTGDIGDDTSFTLIRGLKPRLLRGDIESSVPSCEVDGKLSEGDFYEDEGFLLHGESPGAGAGYVLAYIAMGGSAGAGMIPFLVAADDYLAFDYKRRRPTEDYAPATPLTIRLSVTAPPSSTDFSVYPSGANRNMWQSARLAMTAAVGKTIDNIQVFFGSTTVAGLHQFLFRNLRITDVNGIPRRRLWNGSEDRVTDMVTDMKPQMLHYTNGRTGGYTSLGQPFNYDPVQRRYHGAVTNRIHRVKMAFRNQVEIASLDIDMVPAGKE